jgi:hypothetical protein
MRNCKVITITEAQKLLESGQGDQLVAAIAKMPTKSGKLSLTLQEYRALSGVYKGLFLWVGGRIKRPSMTRAAFDALSSPRQKATFLNEGGKLTES